MPGNASYNLTQHVENWVLDQTLGVGSLLLPSGIYVALFGATPGDESTFASELSTSIASRYERVRGFFAAGSAGFSENATDALFATAGGAWPTIVAIGLVHGASAGAGSLIWWGGLSSPQVALVNQRIKLTQGDLDVTVD
jgi:hypothetical protein